MQADKLNRGNEIRHIINAWLEYREIIENKVKQNSEFDIPYGDKPSKSRNNKIEIARELIELLNKRTDQNIAELELEFTKL